MSGKRFSTRILVIVLCALLGLLILPLTVGASRGGSTAGPVDKWDTLYPWPDPGVPGEPSLTGPGGTQAKAIGIGPGYEIKMSSWDGPYWSGVFVIQIRESGGDWGPNTYAYCADIYHPLIVDTPMDSCGNTISHVAYILNTYPPTGSTSNYEAAAVQAAIWHYSDGVHLVDDDDTPQAIRDRYAQIVADTDANGAGYGQGTVPDSLVLTPESDTNPVGHTHTVSALVMGSNGAPMSGVTVYFEITAGPHVGQNGSSTTNGSGVATWSYTGTGLGTDTIDARTDEFNVPRGIKFCYPDYQTIVLAGDPQPIQVSDTVSKTWVCPECEITADPFVCEDTGGHTASTTFIQGATYLWTVTGGSVTGGQGTHSITYAAGSGSSLTLDVQVTAGACQYECDEVVTIKPDPVCTIQAPQGVCEETGGHTASTTGGYASYDWDIVGGTITSGDGTAQITFSANQGVSQVKLSVVVVDSNGCEAECDETVTVYPDPTCTIQAPQGVCEGTGGHTASTTGGYASYNWDIVGGTITGGDDTAQITFSANQGVSQVKLSVTVVDSNGCEAECDEMVTVYPDPNCTIQAPDGVCEGTGGHIASTTGGYTSYNWDIIGGTITSGDDTAQITFSANQGASQVKLSVTVVDSNGCEAECDETVDVYSKPSCTIQAPETVCEGTGGYTASTTGGYASYDWDIVGGTITSGDDTAQITFSANQGVSQVKLSVVVVDSNGCEAECDETVPVSPGPDCTIQAPQAVCEGTGGHIASTTGGYASYDWDIVGGTIMGGDDTAQITFSANQGVSQVKLSVTVVDSNGCEAECDEMVTVYPDPNCTIQAPDEVCEGTGGHIASTTDGYTSYNWDIVGGTITFGGGTTQITFSANEGVSQVKLSVTVVDSNGCEAECDETVDVYPEPSCTIQAPETVCEGTGGYTASTTGGYASYVWSIIGGTITSGDGTAQITFSANQGVSQIELSVVVVDSNGCEAECDETVTVSPGPDCTIQAPQAVCEGTGGHIASTTGGYASYDWDIVGGTITGGDNTAQITFSANQGVSQVELSVTVVDRNGCEAECDETVTVYPDPDCTIQAPDGICEGSGGHTASTTGGYVSYAWDIVGGTITSGDGTAQITFSPSPGAIEVELSVVVVDSNGCEAECETMVDVYPSPNCTIEAPSSVCDGEEGCIASTVPGYVSYDWDIVGGTITGGDGTAQITFSANQGVSQVELRVVVVDANGCEAECDTTVDVEPNPEVLAIGDEVCEGEDAVLTSSASGCVDDTILYVWSKGGVEVGTGATLPISGATMDDAGQYKVVATCERTGCSAAAFAMLVVHPYPRVTLDDVMVCLGRTAELSADVTSSGDCADEDVSIAWYRWDAGAWQLVAGENGTTLSVAGLPAGTYQYKVVVCCGECCGEDEAIIDVEPCQMLAIKYHDRNGNGVQDDGEERLAGWTMTLYDALDHEVDSRVTDSNGEVLFTGLEYGQYTVVETLQDGWENTTPLEQAVGINCYVTATAEFGNVKCMRIYGHKWEDTDSDGIWDDFELPIEGWMITLTGGPSNDEQSMATLGDGSYEFIVCEPGDYSVSEESRDGWEPTTPDKVSLVVVGGQDIGPIDFGNHDNFYTLGSLGAKFWDLNRNGIRDSGEPGLPNVTIIMRDSDGNEVYRTQTLDSPSTPGHGQWKVDKGLPPGVYTVQEVVPAGWVQTAPNTNSGVYQIRLKADDTFELLSPEPSGYDGGLTFGNARYMGFKFYDLNSNARRDPSEVLMSNWRIVLKDMALNIVYDTATDGSGFWWLERALPEGDYYVVEVQQAEWTQTYPNVFAGGYKIHLDANGNYTLLSQQPSWYDGLNFGNARHTTQLCPDCPEWVVFQSDRNDENFDIYRMRFDGTDVWRLTNALEDDTSPTWSFDGSRIAFASLRDGDWEVYRMGPDGGGQFNVTDLPDADDRAPSWACYWIAFQTNRDGNWEIYKTDPNGIDQIRLTDHMAADEAPAWSPDEQWIAFQSDREGNWDIYVMDASGNNLRQLTNDPGADQNPTWSVDQQWIAFESNRDGNVSLYKMRVETGEIVRLTDETGTTDTNAAWMPYCEYIWFQSNRDGDNEVYRMQYDGSQQTNISTEPDWFDVLDYAPPGSGVGPSVSQVLVNGQDGYDGCEDATLDEWAAAQARGGEHTVRVRSGGVRSAPIRFDLDSLPDGISVQSARLQMYVIEQTNASALKAGAYALTRAWVEDEVTYNLAGIGDPWTVGGALADIAPEAAGSAALSQVGKTVNWDLTALVVDWLADPGSNHGVLLKGEDTSSVEYALVSSEHANRDWRPRLIVVYEYTP